MAVEYQDELCTVQKLLNCCWAYAVTITSMYCCYSFLNSYLVVASKMQYLIVCQDEMCQWVVSIKIWTAVQFDLISWEMFPSDFLKIFSGLIFTHGRHGTVGWLSKIKESMCACMSCGLSLQQSISQFLCMPHSSFLMLKRDSFIYDIFVCETVHSCTCHLFTVLCCHRNPNFPPAHHHCHHCACI